MDEIPKLKRGRGRPRKYPRAEDIAREAEYARLMAGPPSVKRVPKTSETGAGADPASANDLQELLPEQGMTENGFKELSPEARKIASELFMDLDQLRAAPETAENAAAPEAGGNAAGTGPEQPVKRKRGRPRKNPEDLAVNRRQREKEKNMVVVKVPTYEAMYGNTTPLYTRPDAAFGDKQDGTGEEQTPPEPAANTASPYRQNLSNRPQSQIRTSNSTGINAPSPAAGVASDIIRNTDLARQADLQRNQSTVGRNSWPLSPRQTAAPAVRQNTTYGAPVAQQKPAKEITSVDRSRPSEFKGPGVRMGKVVEIGGSKLTFYYVVFKNPQHDDPIYPDTMHTLQHLMSFAAQQCKLNNVVKVLPCGSRTAFEVAVIDPPQDFPVSDLRRLMIMAGYIKTLPQEELERCSCPDYMNLDDAHRELQVFVETVYGVTIGGYTDNREL